MRSRARWLAAAVMLASCSRPAAPPAASPSPTPMEHRARLIAVEGDVRVKRSSGNDYETAAKGDILSIADLVSTGPSGHATIAFDDGSTAMVTPHSLVSIE
ncbi:MAG TPA: hypothetical protein VMV18_02065, partial [bacterium]|nr:hypothetical protein [bacterium]